MKRFIAVVFIMVLLLVTASGVHAIDSPFVIDNVPNVVGFGGGMAPDYLGSDDYQGVAAPFARWTFDGQERYLQLMVTELSFNVLNHPNFTLGPLLNFRFGRNDSVEDDVVKMMQEIDNTVEAGLFAGYTWRDTANPRHRLITSLAYYHDVGDKHDGWLIQGGARYWYPVSRPLDLLIGVGATYGDSNYTNTYFGVSSADATKTGLKKFEASSGLRDVNFQLAAVFHLSMDWHIGAGVKYFKLLGDASDSPIVDQRGDSSQWVAGLGVAYSW